MTIAELGRKLIGRPIAIGDERWDDWDSFAASAHEGDLEQYLAFVERRRPRADTPENLQEDRPCA